jgi:hypothetical protein
MRLLSAVALLVAVTSLLGAAEDCGVRWYWNGFAYFPEDRDFWTRHFPEKGYPACSPEGCCPPGFTIQDNICKPYRGR